MILWNIEVLMHLKIFEILGQIIFWAEKKKIVGLKFCWFGAICSKRFFGRKNRRVNPKRGSGYQR